MARLLDTVLLNLLDYRFLYYSNHHLKSIQKCHLDFLAVLKLVGSIFVLLSTEPHSYNKWPNFGIYILSGFSYRIGDDDNKSLITEPSVAYSYKINTCFPFIVQWLSAFIYTYEGYSLCRTNTHTHTQCLATRRILNKVQRGFCNF